MSKSYLSSFLNSFSCLILELILINLLYLPHIENTYAWTNISPLSKVGYLQVSWSPRRHKILLLGKRTFFAICSVTQKMYCDRGRVAMCLPSVNSNVVFICPLQIPRYIFEVSYAWSQHTAYKYLNLTEKRSAVFYFCDIECLYYSLLSRI